MLEAANNQQNSDSVVEPKNNSSNNSISYDESQQQQQQQQQSVRQGQSAAAATANPSPSVVVVDGSGTSSGYDLAHFEPVRILSNNSTHRTVSLLGHFGNLSRDQYAILVLEKTAFSEAQLRNSSSSCRQKDVTTADSDVEKSTTTTSSESECNNHHSSTTAEAKAAAPAGEASFFSSKSQLRTEFINDIYGNFLCVADPEVNQLKVSIIYPASEKHISKYSAHARYLLEETVHDYRSVTLPHLEQEQLSLEWLYNILEHRKEKDRIIYEDPSEDTGFILLPDLKWDGKTVEQLYLLALVRPKGIKSLRDLTAAHLPLLRNLKESGTRAIKERYGIDSGHLRVYVHYQPSFYHLHVHFTYLKHDPPGIHCEKSHLLTTIIENLELVPDYYQRVTLSCVLSETDKLYAKLKAAKEKADDEQPEAKRAKLEYE